MAKKSRKVFATTATAALVASAVAPIASSAAGFSDVTKPEYKTAIDALAEAGILNGYENGTFKPENKVTRGEVAKVITLIRHLEEGTKTPFKDVKDGYWSTPYINSLYAAKLINGYENGTFKPEGNITRAEFAKLVVDAYGLTLTNAATPFTDVKAGNWATPYIQTAYANGLIKGVTASKFDPSAPIKRGDLAILLHRADSKFGDVIGNNFPGVELVKATNNTTVEVTFKNEVDAKDVQAAKFSIEGLTVTNAAVKQTDSKTVVLTTSAQEGGKQYTVKSGSATLGKFIGASAVVPTSIKVTTPSVQGTIGKEVTLKAEVTVEDGKSKAGIPVTFNIVSDNSNLNSKIEVEALTDENGVASYSYTRYYKHNDNVTAYATQKSQVYSSGKVYWAEGLTVTESTEGNTLANGSKKVYKIKTDSYQVQKDASGKEEYKYVNVAFAENVDVTPDKLVRGVKVIDTGLSTNADYPYQVTTGGVNKVRVKVNEKGEGTFTLTGSNASVTPIVFVHTNKDEKLTSTDLQAKAATVKFDLNHTLGLDVKAEGVKNAASISTENKGTGGREYTVTITDKDGKVAPKGTVAYVTFQKGSLSVDRNVYVDDVLAAVGKTYEIKVTNDKGQASFVLTGQKDAYATPTVFINNGTSKDVSLDDNDLQKSGETTYFVDAVVENATLTATDGTKEVTSLPTNKQAVFKYQSVDQNGFAYYAGTGSYEVTFQVKAQFGDVKISDGTTANTVTVKKGSTESIKVTATKGEAKLYVDAIDGVSSNITVDASSTLPNKNVSFSFVNAKELPAKHTGFATINQSKEQITFDGFDPVSYSKSTTFKNENGVEISKAEFEKAFATYGSLKVTATKNADGVYAFEIVAVDVDANLSSAKASVPADLSIYTADSVKAVNDALNLPETTVAEKAAKAKAINEAVAALKVDATGTLNAAKASVPADLTIYTALSVAELNVALNQPESTDAEKLAKADKIKVAVKNLVIDSSVTPVDPTSVTVNVDATTDASAGKFVLTFTGATVTADTKTAISKAFGDENTATVAQAENGTVTITVVDKDNKAVDLSSLSEDAEVSFAAVLKKAGSLDNKDAKVILKWNNTDGEFVASVASSK